MPLYRVTYQSMTAFYGPQYIEADSEQGAKAQCTAFSRSEWPLIQAVPVTVDEMRREMRRTLAREE